MRAGQLKHLVTFQEKQKARDNYGAEKVVWIDKFSTRADIKFKTGSKVIENYELTNTQQIDIVIRFRTDVTEQLRIKTGNNVYKILFINPEPFRQQLIISVEKYTSEIE